LEDQGVDERMGSEWILGRLAGGCIVDPVGSGDRGQCLVLVSTVMNLQVLAPQT
jgi:hypothetical protein